MAVAPTQIQDMEVREQVASLTTRVAGLDDGQKNIIATLAAITAKIDARNAPNYGLILTLVATLIAGGSLFTVIFGGIGGLVWSQLSAENTRVASALIKLDDKFMPASQIDHELTIRGEKNKMIIDGLMTADADNRRQIERLQEGSVTKSELGLARDAIKDLDARTRALESGRVPAR